MLNVKRERDRHGLPLANISRSVTISTLVPLIRVYALTSFPGGGSLILANKVLTLINPKAYESSMSKVPCSLVGSSTSVSDSDHMYFSADFFALSLDSTNQRTSDISSASHEQMKHNAMARYDML
jgi:hypothetical protein